MDFTIGMKCPSCKEHNNFIGGTIGSTGGDVIKYKCNCGFFSFLVVPNKGYSNIEIKFIEDKMTKVRLCHKRVDYERKLYKNSIK